LLTELFDTYEKIINGEVIDHSQLASVYRDFVAQELQELGRDDSRTFWAQKLEGSQLSRLPRLHTEPQPLLRYKSTDVLVERELSNQLQDFARRLGVSLKSVLLAAHIKVMSSASGDSDLVTGVVTNGRLEEPDGDKVIGLFLNTVPFRVSLSGGSWEDLVRTVFDEEGQIMSHRRFP